VQGFAFLSLVVVQIGIIPLRGKEGGESELGIRAREYKLLCHVSDRSWH